MKRTLIFSLAFFAFGLMPVNAQTKVVPILEMKVGGLIGGVQNGKFLDAKTTAAKLKGGETYSLFSMMGKEEGEITGVLPKNDQDVCDDFFYIELDPKPVAGVALGDGYRWDPVPRVPKALSLTDKTYIKVASDFLKLNGIAKPVVKLTQLYRIDLEGDGKDEIIMSATHYSNDNTASAKTGDYSFTIVRKIVAGKVKNLMLGGDFIKKGFDFGAPNTYEVSAVLDLNGDGKLEIVHHGFYYEGSGTAVYQIINGKDVEIKALGAACGV
jgi:hypothetical protein